MVISLGTRVASLVRRRDRDRRMPALLGRAKGNLDDRIGLALYRAWEFSIPCYKPQCSFIIFQNTIVRYSGIFLTQSLKVDMKTSNSIQVRYQNINQHKSHVRHRHRDNVQERTPIEKTEA